MEHPIIMCNDTLGTLWTIGWIFTIGYLRLSFWKGVLALIIWPYYMGIRFSPFNPPEKPTEKKFEEVKAN